MFRMNLARIVLSAAWISLLAMDAADAQPVLFEDNFADLKNWGDKPSEHVEVKDNALVLRASKEVFTRAFRAQTINQEIDARCKVRLTGDDETGRGVVMLVFWATDANNFYTLNLTTDGTVNSSFMADGRLKQLLTGRKIAQAKVDPRSWTDLRVVTRGKQATLYVNDVAFGTITGEPPADGWKIGVSARTIADPLVAELANVRVVAATPPPMEENRLFSDDFRFLPSTSITDADSIVRGTPEGLSLEVQPQNTWVHAPVAKFAEVDARCKFRFSPDRQSGLIAGGLMFWRSLEGAPVEFFNFTLTNTGIVNVIRLGGEKPARQLNPQLSPFVSVCPQEWHELRVVTRGAGAMLFLNGVPIGTIAGRQQAGEFHIGAMISNAGTAPQQIEISDLIVLRPTGDEKGLPILAGKVLLADDFSRVDPAWRLGVLGSAAGNVLKIDSPGGRNSFFRGGVAFEDMDATVQMRMNAPLASSFHSIGLLFWADAFGNSHLIEIDGTNFIRIIGRSSSDNGSNIYLYAPQSKVDFKGWTKMRVVTRGNVFRLFANDVEVGTLVGQRPGSGPLSFGLDCRSLERDRVTAEYANLKITQSSAIEALPIPSPPHIFVADDFSFTDLGWGLLSKGDGARNNMFLLSSKANETFYKLRDSVRLADFDAAVKLKPADSGGTGASSAGLMFWCNKSLSVLYRVGVADDNTVFVRQRLNNLWSDIHPSAELTSKVKVDAKSFTSVRVVARGRQATIQVNSVEICQIEHPKDLNVVDRDSSIGFWTSSGEQTATAEFKDLIVRQPTKIP